MMYKTIITLAWVVTIASLIVMVGWFLDIDILKRIVPGFVTMKYTTSLAFFFSGANVFLIAKQIRDRSDWIEVVLPISALMVSILMGTGLLSVIFGFTSGIENLFVKETADALFTAVPGRPSIGTMSAFILAVIASLSALIDSKKNRVVYMITGPLIVVLGGTALIGYVLGNPVLFYLIDGISTAMAVHTALLFIFLGAGIFLLSKLKPKGTKIKHSPTQ